MVLLIMSPHVIKCSLIGPAGASAAIGLASSLALQITGI